MWMRSLSCSPGRCHWCCPGVGVELLTSYPTLALPLAPRRPCCCSTPGWGLCLVPNIHHKPSPCPAAPALTSLTLLL